MNPKEAAFLKLHNLHFVFYLLHYNFCSFVLNLIIFKYRYPKNIWTSCYADYDGGGRSLILLFATQKSKTQDDTFKSHQSSFSKFIICTVRLMVS